MLRIITGPSGSGKTYQIMQELKRLVADGSGRAFLLVPEQYSHQKEREVCSVAGERASAFVEVLSFKSLARRVLWEQGGIARPLLSDGGRLLCMRRAIAQVAPMLDYFAAPAARADFLPRALSAVEEFYRYRVEPGDLARAAEKLTGETTRKKLRELDLIYTAYASLCAAGAADPTELLTLAAGKMGDCRLFTGSRVYVDGFAGFTSQEWEMLKELSVRCGEMTVALTAPGDETPFEGPYRCLTSLQEIDDDVRIERHDTVRRSEKASLRRLGEAYFDPEKPCAGPVSPEGVTLWTAEDRRSECMAVAAEIRRLCVEGDYRYREIAVMARSFAPYADLLEGIFAEYDVPVFSDRTRTMREQPLFRLVDSALACVLQGFDSDPVLRNLRCALSGVSREECDRLERYARVWDLPGWRWTSDRPWSAPPAGMFAKHNEKSRRELERLDDCRRRALAPLAELGRATEKGGTAKELCTAVYAYIQNARVPESLSARRRELTEARRLRESEELGQSYACLCEALDQIVAAGADEPMTLREFADALRLVLGEARIGSIPDSLDSVAAGEAGRMRISAPRVVFILGANEGVLPAPTPDGGLLSDEERRDLDSVAGLTLAPAGYDAAAAENYILYSMLTAPSEALYLSAPLRGDDGKQLEISTVMNRIHGLLPGAEILPVDMDEARTRSRAGCLELAAADGAGAAAAREALAGDPSSETALGNIRRALKKDPAVSERAWNEAVFGSVMRISPSKLEAYQKCHFSYFAEHGLQARPIENARLDRRNVGTFTHEVLERVARRVAAEGGWKATDRAALREKTGEAVQEFLEGEGGVPEDARTPRLLYYVERLKSDTAELVDRMYEELSLADFAPVAFELDLNDGREPKRYSFGGEEITLVGKVDRLDAWEQDGRTYLRVVDYKTGPKDMEYRDLKAGLVVQMLFYLFLLSDEKGGIPAGVLYMPAAVHTVSANEGQTEDDLQKARDEGQRCKGLLLDEGDVIGAMEHAEDAGKTRFIPYKDDYKLTAQEFMRLRDHLQSLLDGMVRELRRGDVCPSPYIKSEKETPCIYCRFRAVCRFDRRQGDRARFLPRIKKADFFTEEAEANGTAVDC